MNGDREKILKERDVSMHWIDGVYLVDQSDKFLIPNASTQLKNLSDIIRTMITFKNRVISLQQNIESALKSRKKLNRGGTQHVNDSIVYASPPQKKI
ncbi:hypothetical protein RirG_091100 [Rhizophagus irregularis DAOM 197198w]|nr:hypothetical protein RirG_091100 [Rhizophagus irregularis DAOM 197198w]